MYRLSHCIVEHGRKIKAKSAVAADVGCRGAETSFLTGADSHGTYTAGGEWFLGLLGEPIGCQSRVLDACTPFKLAQMLG